jgi:hypothetical protein
VKLPEAQHKSKVPLSYAAPEKGKTPLLAIKNPILPSTLLASSKPSETGPTSIVDPQTGEILGLKE